MIDDVCLKGQCHKIFCVVFLQKIASPCLIRGTLRWFRFMPNFHGDIWPNISLAVFIIYCGMVTLQCIIHCGMVTLWCIIHHGMATWHGSVSYTVELHLYCILIKFWGVRYTTDWRLGSVSYTAEWLISGVSYTAE